MKLFITILTFTLIMLPGCRGNVENPCSLSKDVWAELKKGDSIFSDSVVRHRMKGWMKGNYDEPDVFEAEHETYRLVQTCFGSWNYTRIVRIEKLENHYNAIVKEFTDTIEAGVLTPKIYEFELTEEDWQMITNKLTADNFWISTAFNYKKLLHGCTWSLEGYKPIKDKCSLQNYHAIEGCYPVDSLYISMYEIFDKLKQK